MKFKYFVAATAAAAALAAPLAAQAGTSASTAVPVPANFGARESAAVGHKHKAAASFAPFLFGAGGAALVTWGVIEATKNKSRGD